MGVNDRCWTVQIEDDELSLVKTFRTDFTDGAVDSYQKLVKFSPDGSIFATSGTDGFIRVWNGSKKTEITVGSEVADMAFLDEHLLVYVVEGKMVCYDISKGSPIYDRSSSDGWQYRCVQVSDNRIYTIENSKDRRYSRVSVFDGGELVSSRPVSVRKAITTFNASSGLGSFGCADGSIGVIRLSDLSTCFFKHAVHSFAVTSIQITDVQNGYLLLSGSADGSVKMIKSTPSSSRMLIILAILVLLIALLLSQDQYRDLVSKYLQL